MPSFADIPFRYTDAESEQTYAPDVIKHAFVDIDNVSEAVLQPDRYFVYGSKGSGKTALAAHLHLRARMRQDWHIEINDLAHFDFRLLEMLEARGRRSIGGTLAAWEAILALRIVATLATEPGFAARNPEIVKLYTSLSQVGFFGAKEITTIAQETARKGAFARLARAFSSSRSADSQTTRIVIRDPAQVNDILRSHLSSLQPLTGKYVLLVDGLDYPLRRGLLDPRYVSELLTAVKAINERLFTRRVDAKIVLLLRDEILKTLPDPDLAKRLNDHAIRLHWYDNIRQPMRSSLLRVIEKRARLAGFSDSVGSLLASWLPKRIVGKATVDYILEDTRCLPRDLIRFFHSLQDLGKEPPFTTEDVLEASRQYSDWFYDELSGSLVGLVPEHVRSHLSAILTRLGRRFRFTDLEAAFRAAGLLGSISAKDLASWLFLTGWIGNLWQENGRPRFSFAHRRRRASFDLEKDCLVHHGLWRALNLS